MYTYQNSYQSNEQLIFLFLERGWWVNFVVFIRHHIFLHVFLQGYVDFGRFDKFNHFVAGSGHVDFVQV